MNAIRPGGTIGILGGGQLGRMMTMEAHRMGYRVGVLDPMDNSPAGQVADFHVQSELTANQHVLEFVAQVDVVTIETELVPSTLLASIQSSRTTHPSARVLGVVQDRLVQRQFLYDLDLPQTSFGSVMDTESLGRVGERIGFPSILKKRCSGYDGKGQVRVDSADGLHDAWRELREVPSVLEAVVPFQRELSIVLARGQGGEVRFYPLAENVHRQNMLYTTKVPAQVNHAVQAQAEEHAASLAEAFDYCGVMAVEFFLLEDETLLINEIAPRPHNSGHFTLGACLTSQFEQHLRAICGLPLGETSLLRPVMMVNLFGDLWENGSPQWERLFSHPQVRLHLYGKNPPQAGRKMGHFLYFAEPVDEALHDTETLLEEISQDIMTPIP